MRKVAEENGVDVSQSIAELETRAQQVRFGGVDALERESTALAAMSQLQCECACVGQPESSFASPRIARGARGEQTGWCRSRAAAAADDRHQRVYCSLLVLQTRALSLSRTALLPFPYHAHLLNGDARHTHNRN